jgi:hypothetical protein
VSEGAKIARTDKMRTMGDSFMVLWCR